MINRATKGKELNALVGSRTPHHFISSVLPIVLAGLSLFGYGGRVTVIANRFAIHILAAVNEYGAKVISERTRAAIAPGASLPQSHRERPRRARWISRPLCVLRDRGETIDGIGGSSR
jgi:hypothetical protein